MARINMSGYSAALDASLTDSFDNIYTNNASAPLGVGAGLRHYYAFGLYSHCAYVNSTNGICSNQTIGYQYRPYDAITDDMSVVFAKITQALIENQNTQFQNSNYLGQSTKAAYWMLLLGSICAALAVLTGILKNNVTFFASTLFAMAGSLLLLIGASIWTIIIKKSQDVNSIKIASATPVPIGIIVSASSGLSLTWAAFIFLSVSVVPYMTSCCTYRG